MSSEPASSSRLAQRRRSLIVVFFVLVSSVGVTVTAVAWWLHNSLFETESFVALVDPIFTDEEVAVALGIYVGDQVVVALDLETRFEERLGAIDDYLGSQLAEALDLGEVSRRALRNLDLPQFADLAAPLAAAAEERIYRATDAFVRSEAFTMRIPAAVEQAHRAAVALITNDLDSLDNVQVLDGEVRWNLAAVVAAAIVNVLDLDIGIALETSELRDLDGSSPAADLADRLGAALDVELPDDFGQVTIVSVEELSSWQEVARQLDRFLWVITIGTALVIVVAVAVSADRRRTVVQLALGGAVGLLLVNVVQRAISDAVVEAAADPAIEGAVRVVITNVLAGLRGLAWAVVAVALFVAIVAYLLGQPEWIGQFRSSTGDAFPEGAARTRIEASVGKHRDRFIMGGLVVALGAWWILGVGLWSLLIVGGSLLAYLAGVVLMGRPTNEMAAPDGTAISD